MMGWNIIDGSYFLWWEYHQNKKSRSKITFIYCSCKSPLIVTSFKAAGSVCGSGIRRRMAGLIKKVRTEVMLIKL